MGYSPAMKQFRGMGWAVFWMAVIAAWSGKFGDEWVGWGRALVLVGIGFIVGWVWKEVRR